MSPPWFSPAPQQAPQQSTRPLLLTFTDTDFVERFFDGVRAHTGTEEDATHWEELRQYRDYSEPPKAMLDLAGEPLYPHDPDEEPEETTAEDNKPDEKKPQPIVALPVDQRSDATGQKVAPDGWLRKLYLPFHRHFHLLCCEVLCHRPGQIPPVDPKRIVESGYIVRRLVRDPEAVRWEDWIEGKDGNGIWTAIADEHMVPLNGSSADPPEDGAEVTPDKKPKPLDPGGVPIIDWGPPENEPLLKFAFAEGTTELKLAPQPLNPLPANLGEAVLKHSTRWGYLQLATDAKQVDLAVLSGEDLNKLLEALAKEVRTRLKPLREGASALADRIREPLKHLLQRNLLPMPDATENPQADLSRLVQYPWSLFSYWWLELRRKEAIRRYVLAGTNLALRWFWERAEFADPHPTHPPDRIQDVRNRWWGINSGLLVTAGLADDIYDAILASLPRGEWPYKAILRYPDEFKRLLLRSLHYHANPLGADPLPLDLRDPNWTLRESRTHYLLAALLRRVRAQRIRLLANILQLLWANTPRGVIGGLPKTIDDWEQEIRKPNPLNEGLPTVGVGHLSDELDAWLAFEDDRADTLPLWPSIASLVTDDPQNADRLRDHELARELEWAFEEFDSLGAAGGWAYSEQMRRRQAAPLTPAFPAASRLTASNLRDAGIDLASQPERGLLVFPGPAPTPLMLESFISSAAGLYTAVNARPAQRYARERRQRIRPRFDSDSIYAVWCYARVAGRDPCENEQIVWSGRSDVFTLADPMDLLGMPPMQIQMPSIPKLLRDIPRIRRARANPYVQINFPPKSGVITGEMWDDTRRDFRLPDVCAYLWPPFTIIAWILFYLVYSTLITIPGFTWMLVIRICMPMPK